MPSRREIDDPSVDDTLLPRSTGLLTDRYELTMLDAALRDGSAGRACVFEVFARRLPEGRRYGVVAGTGRLLQAVADFTFPPDQVDWLREQGVIGADTAAFLASYRFSGDIDGYAEGELYFPYSPILTVRGTFADAVVLETLVLSVLNHDCAVAAAASRFVTAAGERPVIEMGRDEPMRRRRWPRPGPRTCRFQRHVQPGRRTPLRHPDDGHGRARLHAPAR